MSLLVFGQYLGASIFITVANTIFRQSLDSKLHAITKGSGLHLVPGDSSIAKQVPPPYRKVVLKTLAESIDHTFVLTAALSAALFLASLGIGHRVSRKPKAIK